MQTVLGTQLELGEGAASAAPMDSLAGAQRSVLDPTLRFPLFPPILNGIRAPEDPDVPHAVELDFDYDRLDRSIFQRRAALHGLDRWAPLMPPLVKATNLGEGATSLVEVPQLADWARLEAPLYIKDESGNPTWSHKDRLNRCAVSTACLIGAPGIAVASSGNHGASASAYAARAGLPCVVLASDTAPLAMRHFVRAYGAAALAVPSDRRTQLLSEIVQATGFHPVSNLVPNIHVGHPFGTEGYKSIAYEIFQDLGGVAPSLIFVPTGYAELLYGVWKGFRELHELGLAANLPAMVAAEPAVLAPHHRALSLGQKFSVLAAPASRTRALSIAAPMGGMRGYKALVESRGIALAVTEQEIADAHKVLAHKGFWPEFSSAAGLAALRQYLQTNTSPQGPTVFINTAPGLKDIAADNCLFPRSTGDFADARKILTATYGLKI